MTRSEKITVVIPAYNEGRIVAQVVEAVRHHADEVVVVDDASTDLTAKSAERAGATVIRHETNQGYDASLNDGFDEAFARGAAIAVSFDADGEHCANDIPRIVEPILTGAADVVISQRPTLTRFAERTFALYTRHRFGIRDPLCGFKAYHRRVYERFGRFDTLRSIGTELTLRSVKAGFRLRTISIERRVRVDNSRFYARRLLGNLRIFRAMGRVVLAVR